MQRYLESRTITSTSTTAGADLARHLLSRQHLGKTVVICDKPVVVMSVIRKYWLRLTRGLQKERSSTLNAEKILQLTHDITHMQHMEFVAKPFPDQPRSDVFFVTPDQIELMPPNCFSLYLFTAISRRHLAAAIGQLPNASLIIDYSHTPAINTVPLEPKTALEQRVVDDWQQLEQFLRRRGVDMRHLASHPQEAGAIDDALDIMLDAGNQFTRVADDFLELLRLAQPFNVPVAQQQLYDLLSLLDRRIYALTPGILSQQFMQALGDPDENSLHDVATEMWELALAL